MASIDVLASVLVDLEPELNETYVSWHPFLQRVFGPQKKLARMKSYEKDFKVITGGPGAVTKIAVGNEVYAATRRQNMVRGNQIASRYIYDFAIPGKDLAQTNGSPDMIKSLVKEYPEQALNELLEWVAAQLARGAASSGNIAAAAGLDGLVTFNGQQDYTPESTARDGVFMPAAKASQTNTVFGIPMEGAASSPTTGWYHQYGHIDSFTVNGMQKFRRVRDDANRQGGKASGIVDLILCDSSTYANYQSNLDEHVEVAQVVEDHVPAKIRAGMKFGGADVFDESAIDITDTTSFTTAATRAGVAYFINTSQWDGFCLGEDEKMETKGFFSFRGPTRIPDQDMWRWEIINDNNIYCKQLRNQGLVTGGATE